MMNALNCIEEKQQGITYKLNNEKKGVEIYFTNKPTEEVRGTLKVNGFRWSNFNKCWYSKQTESTIQLAESLVNNKALETITEVKQTKKVKKENTTLNLWDAAQFTKLEGINKEQDCKTLAKEIRTHIKKRFPQCKFSVTVPYYGRISFDIKSSPYEKDSVYLKAILKYCESLLNAYRHTYDEADHYSDYAGSYNFTGWVSVAWDYEQTESNEQIKNDMVLFDSNLVEFEKAEKERKEKEFKEYMEQQEIKNAEYKKQQEEEQKQIEHIYNNINTKELNEIEQYFIVNAEFAHLNKNNTINEYIEEVKKGECSLENVKVTKEIHFNNLEALNNFSNLLLTDFNFLENTGGSYTDANRINSMIDFNNMGEMERKSVQWNLYGVAVYFNNKLQFVIDAQGFSYARYVGLTTNAEIKKELTTIQVLSTDELTDLKYKADQLEDISTSVIESNNIIETWKEENWNLYKNSMKEKLKEYDFKLTKGIIQQLEIEDLKPAMYKLLSDVDSIQDQFSDANIQQGEKITLFYISDFGSIVTSKVIFDNVVNESYAQYKNAVKLTFKPENKRSLHYSHFYSTLLVYKGWLSLPETVLYKVEEKNGFRVTSSKFHSCDNRQYDEILNYFDQQGIKPIVNTYKPEF